MTAETKKSIFYLKYRNLNKKIIDFKINTVLSKAIYTDCRLYTQISLIIGRQFEGDINIIFFSNTS
jgi:hypothetical protein